jgi:hypothetical protein
VLPAGSRVAAPPEVPTIASGQTGPQGACRFGIIENVRLRNVPVDVNSKMPKALQIKAGKIDSARCTATAYIRFSCAEEAKAALALNMAVLEGTHLRVDCAAAPSSKAGVVQYEPKRSVFIGNIAFDTQVQRPPSQCPNIIARAAAVLLVLCSVHAHTWLGATLVMRQVQ